MGDTAPTRDSLLVSSSSRRNPLVGLLRTRIEELHQQNHFRLWSQVREVLAKEGNFGDHLINKEGPDLFFAASRAVAQTLGTTPPDDHDLGGSPPGQDINPEDDDDAEGAPDQGPTILTGVRLVRLVRTRAAMDSLQN